MSEAQSKKQSTSLNHAVKVASRDITNRPTHSNIVRVSEISEHPEVLRLTEHTYTSDGTVQQIGKILTRAQYASEWSDGTYMVEADL